MKEDSRARQMLIDYQAGHTLQKIGKANGLTRERVRQLLSIFPEYREARIARKKLPSVVSQCLSCGVPILRFSFEPVPKTCSKQCWQSYVLVRRRERFLALKEKRCSLCGKVKPVSEFYKQSGKDVYYAHCRECHGDYVSVWHDSHPEKVKIIGKRAHARWYKKATATPEGRARFAARGLAYYNAHKNEPGFKERQKEWHDRYLTRLRSTPEGDALYRARIRKRYVKTRKTTKPYRPRKIFQ